MDPGTRMAGPTVNASLAHWAFWALAAFTVSFFIALAVAAALDARDPEWDDNE